jgi:hypothetical protein
MASRASSRRRRQTRGPAHQELPRSGRQSFLRGPNLRTRTTARAKVMPAPTRTCSASGRPRWRSTATRRTTTATSSRPSRRATSWRSSSSSTSCSPVSTPRATWCPLHRPQPQGAHAPPGHRPREPPLSRQGLRLHHRLPRRHRRTARCPRTLQQARRPALRSRGPRGRAHRRPGGTQAASRRARCRVGHVPGSAQQAGRRGLCPRPRRPLKREEFYTRVSRFSRLPQARPVESHVDPDHHRFGQGRALQARRRAVSENPRLGQNPLRRGNRLRDYEKQIQKMLATYVPADEVIQVVAPVNIFEREAFQAEVDKRSLSPEPRPRYDRQPHQEDDHRENGGRPVLLPKILPPPATGHRRLQGPAHQRGRTSQPRHRDHGKSP